MTLEKLTRLHFEKWLASYSRASKENNTRWQSQFTVIASGKRVALDCLFLVEFNETGECSVFREWWRSQTTEAGQKEGLHEYPGI